MTLLFAVLDNVPRFDTDATLVNVLGIEYSLTITNSFWLNAHS